MPQRTYQGGSPGPWRRAWAFDPGEHTGYAIVRWEPGASLALADTHAGVLDTAALAGELARLDEFEPTREDHVLIERPPAGVLLPGAQAQQIEVAFRQYGCTILRIAPAQWKPFVRAHPYPSSWRRQGESTHEKDAKGLLWYWLHTFGIERKDP